MGELMLDTLDAYHLVREYTDEAKGIAFDTCHKIYILMDENQVDIMRGYGYGNENDPDSLITSNQMNPAELATIVVTWFQRSCGLRFIQALSTGEQGEPVFEDIIGQFDDYDDEDEDDDDD